MVWDKKSHKQIAQITKELGRTAYKDAKFVYLDLRKNTNQINRNATFLYSLFLSYLNRMCILASREHTCIDPIISKGPKKNEECKNKLDVSSNSA